MGPDARVRPSVWVSNHSGKAPTTERRFVEEFGPLVPRRRAKVTYSVPRTVDPPALGRWGALGDGPLPAP